MSLPWKSVEVVETTLLIKKMEKNFPNLDDDANPNLETMVETRINHPSYKKRWPVGLPGTMSRYIFAIWNILHRLPFNIHVALRMALPAPGGMGQDLRKKVIWQIPEDEISRPQGGVFP